MAEKRKNSPVVVAIAGGLFTGLGFSFIGPRVYNDMEHSQGLTVAVIAVGFVIGFAVTFLAVRSKS